MAWHGPSTRLYLLLEARRAMAPVLIPWAVPACTLAHLDGMVFQERGCPHSKLGHLHGGWWQQRTRLEVP